MAYRFDGFFARPRVARPAVLPAGAVWREIETPFAGIGVRMPSQDEPLQPQEVRRLRAEAGLGGAIHWLYLSYATWAGRIDAVDGSCARPGFRSGPRVGRA